MDRATEPKRKEADINRVRNDWASMIRTKGVS